jgi:hypothetical protein
VTTAPHDSERACQSFIFIVLRLFFFAVNIFYVLFPKYIGAIAISLCFEWISQSLIIKTKLFELVRVDNAKFRDISASALRDLN